MSLGGIWGSGALPQSGQVLATVGEAGVSWESCLSTETGVWGCQHQNLHRHSHPYDHFQETTVCLALCRYLSGHLLFSPTQEVLMAAFSRWGNKGWPTVPQMVWQNQREAEKEVLG